MIRIAKQLLKRGKEKRNLFEGMAPGVSYAENGHEPIFVTGPGRSGTHFMARLFESSGQISAYHLDDVGDAVGDSFTLYSRWYGLPVSDAGFLNARGYLIQKAAQEQKRFLESNPIIAFSIDRLFSVLGGKVLIMVRHPRKVVESHYRKGWYDMHPVVQWEGQAPGYMYAHKRNNHFFSRFVPPTPTEFEKWASFTRLGKIAWMWRATYQRIIQQLEALPESRYRFVQLEGLSYLDFAKVMQFIGVTEALSASEFEEISKRRPGKGSDVPIEWTTQDKQIFNEQIAAVSDLFPEEINRSNWLFTG